MRTALATAIGLAVGVAAALGLAVAVYSLVPAAGVPTAAPTASPSLAATTPSPEPPATPPAAGPASPEATRSPSPFPLVGQAAPALSAPGLDGATVDLAAYRGRPVWLVFGGSWCPPCRDAYPLMNGFAVRYADAGLVVLGVHVREGAAAVRPFVEELNVTFTVAIDEDGSRAAAWDAVALPVYYWVDAAGVVRDAALGEIGPDQMAAGLGSILPGVTSGE